MRDAVTASREIASDQRSTERHSTSELFGALAALRHGGFDDSSRALELGPVVASSLSAVLVAFRWGAVMVGLGLSAAAASAGDLGVVATLAVSIFLASWRTVRPIKVGDRARSQTVFAMADVAVLGSALGLSHGLTSPFVGCVLVAVAIVAFGWGLRRGIISALIGLGSATIVSSFAANSFMAPTGLAITALIAAATFPGVAQIRLVQMEDRRRTLAGQLDRLAQANDLLAALNDVARTLPSSLDLPDVIEAAKDQLSTSLESDAIVILSYEDGSWSPQVQDGFTIPPLADLDALPEPIRTAVNTPTVTLVEDLSAVSDRAGSGIYCRLIVNGRDTGLIGVEHHRAGFYGEEHIDLIQGMADVLALTLANAREFRRLRSLAAAEERTRIARDLHDRLGQWLTYIALELERVNSGMPEPMMELKQLHEDTQGAISELRDTLVELRASVSADRPLSVLLGEIVDRFTKRSSLEVILSAPTDRSIRLSSVVENELLRIAQEALTNVEKHARATSVTLSWRVEHGRGILIVADDGLGFTPDKGIRGTAYGLVGMRERAASVGAILQVTSEPDQGTTITVLTSHTPER